MNKLTILFKNEKDKELFKAFLESINGIDIDGSSQETFDNYGQFKYVSKTKDSVIVESL